MTDSSISVRLCNVVLIQADGHGARTPLTVYDDMVICSRQARIWKIVGQSGSGKTTLLKLLGLIDRADQGSISWTLPGEGMETFTADRMLASPARHRLFRHHFGFSFQHAPMQPQLNVEENLKIRRQLAGKGFSESELQEQAEKLFGSEARYLLRRYPFEALSMGQKQRFSLLLALVHEPSVLFADEPTANLDSQSTGLIEEYIRNWAEAPGKDRLVLWVTHGEREPARPYIRVADQIARIIG